MPEQHEGFDCPRCSIGHCQPGHITYTRVYGNSLLVLPNTKIFVCDVCGYWEFEAQAIQQIQSVEFWTTDRHTPAIAKTPGTELDMLDTAEIKSGQRPKS